MSEVIIRSLATSVSTLFPITALLVFGGETLVDFAFALLVGVLSGAYSSIFIASPILTHWKERESSYRDRLRSQIKLFGGKPPAYHDDDVYQEKRREQARGGKPVEDVVVNPEVEADTETKATPVEKAPPEAVEPAEALQGEDVSADSPSESKDEPEQSKNDTSGGKNAKISNKPSSSKDNKARRKKHGRRR